MALVILLNKEQNVVNIHFDLLHQFHLKDNVVADVLLIVFLATVLVSQIQIYARVILNIPL